MELVASNLKRLKALPLAAEVFKKLGNEAEVVQLHVEARDWSEAFLLAADIPELLPQVHYQHGQWLAENDKFIEAHEGKSLSTRLIYMHLINTLHSIFESWPHQRCQSFTETFKQFVHRRGTFLGCQLLSLVAF